MVLIPPSYDIKQKIEEDLHQDPDITAADIQHLRQWIRKQPHLPQDHDNMWLERFLYGCKYRLERCKKVFELYYTQRENRAQYFRDVDPISTNMKQISNVYYNIILPKCTKEGYRVFVQGLLDYDVKKFDIISICQREMLLYNCYLRMESNYGFVHIFDMRGMNMQHLARVLSILSDLVLLGQDSIPFRGKQVHFINSQRFAQTIISALQALLKEKLRNIFHVHGDIEDLYKFIPREILPSELGGDAGTIEDLNGSWQKQMENMREWLLEEYKKKTDSTKRPKECVSNELFGCDGSFKKLNID